MAVFGIGCTLSEALEGLEARMQFLQPVDEFKRLRRRIAVKVANAMKVRARHHGQALRKKFHEKLTFPAP